MPLAAEAGAAATELHALPAWMPRAAERVRERERRADCGPERVRVCGRSAAQVFEERTGADGDVQTVRRDQALADNAVLPAAMATVIGDKACAAPEDAVLRRSLGGCCLGVGRESVRVGG